ncbi:hypothetical protein CP083_04620 [Candidatus Bathyarchaeota archaeon B24-2]|nr:MAG: hypothetical protein CP083_04620 [Candidatus Bathyarchaeota archaeon B24-2]
MNKISGARAVVECLKSEGVKYVFGIAGDSLIPILEVLADTPEIRYISVRHEQVATHMADGYARHTGKPSVVLVTRASGASNTVLGVVTAYSSDSPVVVIAGLPPVQSMGRGEYQDFDLVSLFKPITKFSYQVECASKIPYILHRAFRIALHGRPGPVFIGIPSNFLSEEIEPPFSFERRHGTWTASCPPQEVIEEIADMLLKSDNPAILAGNGVNLSKANEELRILAETLAAPVIPEYCQLDLLPTAHPLFIHDHKLLSDIDLLFTVGTNIPDFYMWTEVPKDAKIIQVELDAVQLCKVRPADIGVTADPKAVLNAIKDSLTRKIDDEIRNRLKRRYERIKGLKEHLLSERWPKGEWNATPIRPWRLLRDLRETLGPDAILTHDSGSLSTYWLSRCFDFYNPKTCYCCLGGVMGFALPGALGIKLAEPDRDVVALVGDGSFMMVNSALTTSVQYDIPILIIINDNSSYMQIKWRQKPPYLGSDLLNPDFVKLAESFGVYAERVEDPRNLKQAIVRCLNETRNGRTALLDVLTVSDPRYATPETYFKTSRPS